MYKFYSDNYICLLILYMHCNILQFLFSHLWYISKYIFHIYFFYHDLYNILMLFSLRELTIPYYDYNHMVSMIQNQQLSFFEGCKTQYWTATDVTAKSNNDDISTLFFNFRGKDCNSMFLFIFLKFM